MSAQQDYFNSRQCTGHMTSDMIMNYCRDWLRGMLHTTELDLVVGFAPESFFKQIWSPWLPPVWCPPWYDIHRGVWLSSGMHTAETDSLVWCTPQRLTPWCDAHHRDWLRGMMHTAEFDSVGCTPRKFLTIWRSLRIHRKIIQKYFSLLEAQMGSNHEQIEVKKTLWHTPFNIRCCGGEGWGDLLPLHPGHGYTGCHHHGSHQWAGCKLT